ncbi:MAG TPA: hypothetical protein ACQGQU_00120 [Xylella fastidiosa subsp. multiplex]
MILDEFLIRLGAVADTSGFNTFSTGLTRVTGIVTVAAAAMGGALAGMNRFVGSALSELNALNSASQRTGASLSFLQELGYAARLNGSSVEASTRSIESLSQKIGEAANGVGRGAMLFQKLGLQARQADGSVKSVGDMLGDVQEKIRGLSAPQQHSILANLGMDATMLQTLRLSREELNGVFQEAHDLGVITADGADTALEYGDAMERLRVVLGALRTNIAIGVAPAFTRLIEHSKHWLIANKEQLRDGIGKVVNVLIAAGTAVWNFIRAVNSAVNQTIGWKAVLLAVGAVLARAFALNPVTWLIAGIVALVALVDDFITYLDGGESLLGAFWGPLITYAKRAKAVIADLTPALKALGVLLAGLAIGHVVSNIGRLVGAGRTLAMWLAGPLVKALQVAALALRAAFLSNPIGLVIASVALLAYAIYTHVDTIKQAVGTAWQWCTRTANAAFGSIQHTLQEAAAAAKTTWASIKDACALAFSHSIATADSAVNRLRAVFSAMGSRISAALTSAFDTIMTLWDRTVGRIAQGAERIKGFFRAIAPTLKQAGRDTQDVAQRVNAQVQAAQTTARHAAAQAATPARSQANVHSQQEVKIDIHTADPILAGRQAAADINRHHQMALRNTGSAVAF